MTGAVPPHQVRRSVWHVGHIRQRRVDDDQLHRGLESRFAKYGGGIDLTGGGTIENSTISPRTASSAASAGFGRPERSSSRSRSLRDHGDVTITGGGTLTENYSLIQNAPTLQPGSDHNLNGQTPSSAPCNNGGPRPRCRSQRRARLSTRARTTGQRLRPRHVALFDDSSVTNAADGRDMGAFERRPPTVSSLSPTTAASETRWSSPAPCSPVRRMWSSATNMATFTVDSDTQITATAPGAQNGPVDVTVAADGGTGSHDGRRPVHLPGSRDLRGGHDLGRPRPDGLHGRGRRLQPARRDH